MNKPVFFFRLKNARKMHNVYKILRTESYIRKTLFEYRVHQGCDHTWPGSYEVSISKYPLDKCIKCGMDYRDVPEKYFKKEKWGQLLCRHIFETPNGKPASRQMNECLICGSHIAGSE